MIRLHQTFGVHAGRCVDLAKERIRFGRLPDNDFAFDAHADLDASGRHAEIVLEGGRYVLVDVGSRNGTFLDGSRIERAPLRGGEEIEFGVGGPRVRVEFPAHTDAPRADPAPREPGRAEPAMRDPKPAEPAPHEPGFTRSPETRVPPEPPEARHPAIAPAWTNDGLLKLAIGTLIVGAVIAVVALAVLLGPSD